MKLRNLFLPMFLAVAGALSSCGSGTSSTNATTTSTAPVGPVSYTMIHTMFNPVPNSSLSKSLNASSTACGAGDADAAAGLSAATGFVSLIPVAGPALGALTGAAGSVLGLAGASAGNSCIQQALNSILNQLAVQESQIQQIQQELNLTDNTFYMDNYQQSIDTGVVAISNYNQAIENLIQTPTGGSGLFGNIMYDIGFWNDSLSSGEKTVSFPTSTTLAAYMTSNPNWVNTYFNYAGSAANQDIYQTNLANASGANIKAECNSSYPYQCVQQAQDSVQLVAYQALYNSLLAEIQNQESANYIALYDNYNNTIMQMFQQTVYALQATYYLQYLTNMVNYNNAVGYMNESNALVQTVGYTTNAPETMFTYSTYSMGNESAGQVEEQYRSAQEQLSLLFAAYINQSYINTLQYIVSDQIVGAQKFPTEPTTFTIDGQTVTDYTIINYPANLSSGTVPGIGTVLSPINYFKNHLSTVGVNSDSLLTTLTSTSYGINNNYMIYQYYGLNNMQTWGQSVSSYNATNTDSSAALLQTIAANYESAPQLFINGKNTFVQFDQAFVSGWLVSPTGPVAGASTGTYTFAPNYVADSSSYPESSGIAVNNINTLACNPDTVGQVGGYALYWYIPSGTFDTLSLGTQGTPYLMCGNWQTTGLASTMGNNSGYFGYNAHTLSATPWNVAAGSSAVTDFYYQNNTNTGANWPIMFMGSSSVTNFGSNGSFENISNGTPYSYISAGYYKNIDTNVDYNMVSAAVQIKFPDGFIAGLGLNWSQDNIFNENTHALINSVSTVGLAYNPNMSIVTINGQSLIQNNSIYMINYPGNSSGYPSNWATAIYNYSFYAPDVPDVYMSGLLINGNLVFANGAPAFGGTYNGVSYPEGKTFISLNPAVNLSTNNWSDSCVWPWEYYNQDAQYYLPAFACTLTSNWPV